MRNNIPRYNCKVIACSVFCLLVRIFSYSQSAQEADLISVRLNIIGKGTPESCVISASSYFANIRIINIKDTSIRFWIYDCSWSSDNFVTSVKKIALQGCGCDSNIPTPIILSPKGSIEFFTTINSLNADSLAREIKVGFLYYTSESNLFKFAGKSPNSKAKVYWSNQELLKNNLDSYQIK